MTSVAINNIDDIISALNQIISEAEKNNDPAGYFAVLYKKITIKLKEAIDSDSFDDNQRMEELYLLVAQHYFEAYSNFTNNVPSALSWRKAFKFSSNSRTIVLQHLLLGINAHINFDLGIATAKIAEGKELACFEADFKRLYAIFLSQITEIQDNLSKVWPPLKLVLRFTDRADHLLFDFNIEEAREGTWKFINQYANMPVGNQELASSVRDQKVAAKIDAILSTGPFEDFVLWLIRITERGSIADKIRRLT